MAKEIFAGLPKAIRIGPYDYGVDLVAHLSNDDWGQYSHSGSWIKIRIDHPTPPMGLDTVWHEVSHGIFAFFNLGATPELAEAEEKIVSAFGTGLAMISIDNPSLLTWIQKLGESVRRERGS